MTLATQANMSGRSTIRVDEGTFTAAEGTTKVGQNF